MNSGRTFIRNRQKERETPLFNTNEDTADSKPNRNSTVLSYENFLKENTLHYLNKNTISQDRKFRTSSSFYSVGEKFSNEAIMNSSEKHIGGSRHSIRIQSLKNKDFNSPLQLRPQTQNRNRSYSMNPVPPHLQPDYRPDNRYDQIRVTENYNRPSTVSQKSVRVKKEATPINSFEQTMSNFHDDNENLKGKLKNIRTKTAFFDMKTKNINIGNDDFMMNEINIDNNKKHKQRRRLTFINQTNDETIKPVIRKQTLNEFKKSIFDLKMTCDKDDRVNERLNMVIPK